MPSRRSSSVEKPEGFLEYYVDGAKSDSEKKLRFAEAQIVWHDLLPAAIITSALRLIVAYIVWFFILLMLFYSSTVVISGTSAMVLVAIVVFGATFAFDIIAGQAALPSFNLLVMRPFWTLMRARPGWKWALFWRDTLLSLFEIGVGLSMAYAMQKAVSSINPNAIMAIPVNTLQTQSVYIAVLLFVNVSSGFVIWFLTLGPGEVDGVWLPRSMGITNLARAMLERVCSAAVVTANFVWLYLVMGRMYIPDVFFVFATWTQEMPGSGTDYQFIFGWLLGSSVVMTVALAILNSVISDYMLLLFGPLHKLLGRRTHRSKKSSFSSLFGWGGKRKGDDDDDDDDDNGGGDDTSNTDDE